MNIDLNQQVLIGFNQKLCKAYCNQILLRGRPNNHQSRSRTWSSSSVRFSPNSLATRLRFLNDIFPVSSSSKSLKAFIISSFESFSFILLVIIVRKSSKSIMPNIAIILSYFNVETFIAKLTFKIKKNLKSQLTWWFLVDVCYHLLDFFFFWFKT